MPLVNTRIQLLQWSIIRKAVAAWPCGTCAPRATARSDEVLVEPAEELRLGEADVLAGERLEEVLARVVRRLEAKGVARVPRGLRRQGGRGSVRDGALGGGGVRAAGGNGRGAAGAKRREMAGGATCLYGMTAVLFG